MTDKTDYTKATNFLRELDGDWGRIIDQAGPCLHDPKAAREPYEALVRAIAYQQLTAKAGDAILSRLKQVFSYRAFPTPAELLATPFDALRACGFSVSKIATIQGIAAGALSGLVPARAEAETLSEVALVERLVTIKGIGQWTVEMLLMYSLERLDVLPVGDFGVREGYRILKSLPDPPKPKALHEIGKAWSPYRTLASWYLWRDPRVRNADAAVAVEPLSRRG